MEDIEEILKIDDYIKDERKLPSHITYEKREINKKKGSIKMIQCPICWESEEFTEPTNHICLNCRQEYCQGCLKICEKGEVRHNHENQEKEKKKSTNFCSLTLLLIFGAPAMFTRKYYQFFKDHQIRDNCCVHWFFTKLNLFANIFYCIIFNILSIEIFFIILFPSIIFWKYYTIIMHNWENIYEKDADQCPIIELTVNRRENHYNLAK